MSKLSTFRNLFLFFLTMAFALRSSPLTISALPARSIAMVSTRPRRAAAAASASSAAAAKTKSTSVKKATTASAKKRSSVAAKSSSDAGVSTKKGLVVGGQFPSLGKLETDEGTFVDLDVSWDD